MIFSYLEIALWLLLLYKSTKKSIFSMAAAVCQALPSFYRDYINKSFFISVSDKFYKKHIVTQDFCVSTHDFFYYLENCKFHLILVGKAPSKVLQRLDKYQFIYQEIDCLYCLCKYRFLSSLVTSSGEVFNQLVAVFSIIYDGKELNKHQAYQGNDSFGKSSKNII